MNRSAAVPSTGSSGSSTLAPFEARAQAGAALQAEARQHEDVAWLDRAVANGGHRLILELAGGGGMGNPADRDPDLVARDVRDGMVSPAIARDVYRVALAPDGAVDRAGTELLRKPA